MTSKKTVKKSQRAAPAAKVRRQTPKKSSQNFRQYWQELVVFLFLVWVDLQVMIFWFNQAMKEAAANVPPTSDPMGWWQRWLVYFVWLLPPFVMFVQLREQNIFWGKIIAAITGALSILHFSWVLAFAGQTGWNNGYFALAASGFFFFTAVSMFNKYQCRHAKLSR
jgi:hypothetical protein